MNFIGGFALAFYLTALFAILAVYAVKKMRRVGLGMVLIAACFLHSMATKPGGSISFPLTDADERYISDTGSYVSNDYVRVSYALAAGVPNTAEIVVEKRRLDMTNDCDWVMVSSAMARNFPSPQTIQCPAATNFNWIVYTTYTPGSAVATNGVWHAYWGLDRKAHIQMIPARSCIRVNGEVIATPQSKWDFEASKQENLQ